MSILKKQGVAVLLTMVMVVAAILIGLSKASHSGSFVIGLGSKGPNLNNAGESWYVVDGADVLSPSVERDLRALNEQLYRDMDVVIAVVTSEDKMNDLQNYTMDAAETMELMEYDFIMTLDIPGDNYHLVQGYGLVDVFPDGQCMDYLDQYMEPYFASEDYEDGVLSLALALSQWYYNNYSL